MAWSRVCYCHCSRSIPMNTELTISCPSTPPIVIFISFSSFISVLFAFIFLICFQSFFMALFVLHHSSIEYFMSFPSNNRMVFHSCGTLVFLFFLFFLCPEEVQIFFWKCKNWKKIKIRSHNSLICMYHYTRVNLFFNLYLHLKRS